MAANTPEPLHQPSQGASLALFYITAGILTMIWTGVWYYFINAEGSNGKWQYYVCAGLFLSGTAVTIIGLLVGRIGKMGKKADSPPAGTKIVDPEVAHPAPAAPVVMTPVATAAPVAPVAPAAPAPPAAPARVK